MRESMPDTHGEVDRGPADKRQQVKDWAGEVRYEREMGHGLTISRTDRAYTAKELHALIRQGKELPRPLNMEEAKRAAANRASYREEKNLFESWARAESGATPYMRRTDRSASSYRVPEGWDDGAALEQGNI